MDNKESKSGPESHLQKLYDYISQPISLEKDERTSGLIGWLILASFIVAYDAYAIKTKKVETLTRFFWRNTEQGIRRVVPIIIWSTLTAHLVLEKDVRKKKFGIKNN